MWSQKSKQNPITLVKIIARGFKGPKISQQKEIRATQRKSNNSTMALHTGLSRARGFFMKQQL
jgi:hypothetical protein